MHIFTLIYPFPLIIHFWEVNIAIFCQTEKRKTNISLFSSHGTHFLLLELFCSVWKFSNVQIFLCFILFNVHNSMDISMGISMEMWFLSRRLKKQRHKLYKIREKRKWNYPRENNESVYSNIAQTLLIFLEFHEIWGSFFFFCKVIIFPENKTFNCFKLSVSFEKGK